MNTSKYFRNFSKLPFSGSVLGRYTNNKNNAIETMGIKNAPQNFDM